MAGARLCDHKLLRALVADLEEGPTSRVLRARARLVHAVEQEVDDHLQEAPVVAQGARVPANQVPAVWGAGI